MEKSLKVTWKGAILTFLAPIFLVLFFRWAFFEPYVIPSGSMIPTLLIHDHILVNKWAYGFRLPFTEKWLGYWNKPKPGEIVVFRYPKGRDTFYVKRVVATEGDTIEVKDGQLILNHKPIARIPFMMAQPPVKDEFRDFEYFHESLGTSQFISRSLTNHDGDLQGLEIKVPEGHFFVVGDNRDESSDSRVWGFVPIKNLIGKAGLIWLSCENTLPATPFICDPNSIRWNRLFKSVN